MHTILLILFIAAIVLAIVGLFVPRRLFEIGVLVAVAILGLAVFAGA